MADKENVQPLKLDCQEKAIFDKIIKEGNGGKFYKALTEGISTNGQKHDIWMSITGMFNGSTGRTATVRQLRNLFQRQRKKAKEKHDAAIDRQYRAACSGTGGGPPPPPPPDVDGDMVDDSHVDELDPTITDWNILTRPSQARRFRLGNGRSTPIPSFQQHLHAEDSGSPMFTVRRPVPDISSVSMNTEELAGVTIQQLNPLQQSPSRHAAHPLQQTPSQHAATPTQLSPAVAHSSSPSTVTLVHQNGVSEQIPVERNNNNRKNQKQRKSKTDNRDAATKYYTEILLIQKSMSSLKRRHIRSKIRTEQYKQALMKEKLESNFLPLPDLMESSDSSDNEDEIDDGAE